MKRLLFILIPALLLSPDCRKTSEAGKPPAGQEHAVKDINAAVKVAADSLMKLNGVVGVYSGLRNDSTPCIKVLIEKDDPMLVKKIPQSFDGFPVEVDVSGRIRPMKG